MVGIAERQHSVAMSYNFAKSTRPFIPQILAMLMLLWALLPMNPYGYYVLLRVVVCGVSAYVAYCSFTCGSKALAWILAGTSLLYNPFLPVHLTRTIWVLVNLVTIVLFAYSIVALKWQRATTDREERNGH